MIQALGKASGLNIDAEYLRIIQEMHSLGLNPSGNKTTDAQRLALAKTKLIEKIQNKEENNDINSSGVQTVNPANPNEYSQRSEMEEQRLGAMTIAQLNKIYFGL